MFDQIEFERVEGNASEKKIVLFALTTCSFCKKARAFLEEHNIGYDLVYMNTIEHDLKLNIKIEFDNRFGKRLTYPTLLINDREILTGFIRRAWEIELLE